MVFKPLTDLNLEMGIALTCMLHGFEAMDTERQLCLTTTNGRTRNARRWFVHRYTADYKTDWDAGKVTFRAWGLTDALISLSQPRLANRINKFVQAAKGKTP